MINEIDRQRFQNLLAQEDQKSRSGSSTAPTEGLGLPRRSGDGLGGRFDNQSEVVRRGTGQMNLGVRAERI